MYSKASEVDKARYEVDYKSGWSCKPIWSQSLKKCLQIELLSIRKCLPKRTHSKPKADHFWSALWVYWIVYLEPCFSKPLIQTAILRFLWNFWTLYLVPLVNHLDPGAYMNHILDKAAVLVDLPYDAQAWSALLPWKFKPEDLSWQDRAEAFTSLE